VYEQFFYPFPFRVHKFKKLGPPLAHMAWGGSQPHAGEGRRHSGRLRRRWLASVAAATAAVTVEAVATSAAGKESGAR
jgi:hypothetical protein